MTLRVSSPSKEGVYQASKWLKHQALLDPEEMRDLLDALGPFWIFPLTGLVDGPPLPSSVFCYNIIQLCIFCLFKFHK